MATSSFKDFEKVCKALGLNAREGKNSTTYTGTGYDGSLVRTSVHTHAAGRDIPTGTFRKCIKDIGFKNTDEYYEFLAKL